MKMFLTEFYCWELTGFHDVTRKDNRIKNTLMNLADCDVMGSTLAVLRPI